MEYDRILSPAMVNWSLKPLLSMTMKESRQAKMQEYLIDHPDASLRELGELLGISRQRVHVLLQGMALKNVRITRWRKLTHHQVDILKHIARGYTDRQIAKFMGCSAQSIRNQLQTVYAKLSVHKRQHAVQLVIEQGLVQVSPGACKPERASPAIPTPSGGSSPMTCPPKRSPVLMLD